MPQEVVPELELVDELELLELDELLVCPDELELVDDLELLELDELLMCPDELELVEEVELRELEELLVSPGALELLVSPGALELLISPGALELLVSPGALELLVSPGALELLVSPGALELVLLAAGPPLDELATPAVLEAAPPDELDLDASGWVVLTLLAAPAPEPVERGLAPPLSPGFPPPEPPHADAMSADSTPADHRIPLRIERLGIVTPLKKPGSQTPSIRLNNKSLFPIFARRWKRTAAGRRLGFVRPAFPLGSNTAHWGEAGCSELIVAQALTRVSRRPDFDKPFSISNTRRRHDL